jgi:hypothetical protein
MFSRIKIAHITFVILAFATQGQGTARGPDKAGAVPGSEVVRGDELTKQQFEALPDTAVIEFKGKRITKGEIRAKALKSQEAMAKAQAVARQTKSQFEQRRIEVERQRQAKMQADRTKAMAEFTRLSDAGATPRALQIEAIRKEAMQLYERSKRASPTEQAQIEERAHQLLQRLLHVSPPR